jgi:hypothetical protein
MVDRSLLLYPDHWNRAIKSAVGVFPGRFQFGAAADGVSGGRSIPLDGVEPYAMMSMACPTPIS